MLNLRARGSVAQPRQEFLNGLFVSFRLCLDSAIRAIADPAGQTEPVADLLRLVAKADALNVA